MQAISIERAKEDFYLVMDKVFKGENFIITKDGSPIAELKYISKEKKNRVPGSAKGEIIMGDDFDEPLEEFKDYMWLNILLKIKIHKT